MELLYTKKSKGVFSMVRSLWTVCCIVQKKLLFVCERRFRIALLVGGCIILILLGSIFGMNSTFRLKKDFYLVFFLSGRKKMPEKTHMQKKNLSSGGLGGYLF